MNLPNKLTVIRIALTPVFLFLFCAEFIPHNYLFALIVFVIAAVTDFVDGYIARKYNQVSDFGKFLDPLADKCTQFTLIVCLAIKYPVQNPMLWVLAGLMFVKEIFQLEELVFL